MVTLHPPEMDDLLQRASAGDDQATAQLLALHRDRLKRMIRVRMDRRLAARVDPSDIVQEALADAAEKLPEYLRDRPLPFYPWLRELAWERVVREHRRHLRAKARSVTREEPPLLPDHSAGELAEKLLTHGSSPSERVMLAELRSRVQAALSQLSPEDREVLVLRFLEQLSTREAAEVLGLSEHAVKSRQRRAVERFSRLVEDLRSGGN